MSASDFPVLRAWRSRFVEAFSRNIEGLSYLILVVGSVLDHGSTMTGLALNGVLIEANPFVGWMISRNLWVFFDASVMIVTILSTYLILRRWKDKNASMALIYPFILGVARMAAGLWNLSLLM